MECAESLQTLISWLVTKSADLYLHCFLERIYPGSAGRVKPCYVKSTNGNKSRLLFSSAEMFKKSL